MENMENIEMIISRYNEDLEWLKDDPFLNYNYIVYNKGINTDFYKSSKLTQIIPLDNVGREVHTYLYHIINNYDRLKDITIFLPGSVELSHKYDRSKKLIYNLQNDKSSKFSCMEMGPSTFENQKDFQIDDYLSSNKDNQTINADSSILKSDIRPFGKWFENTFDKNEKHTCFTMNALFLLTRDDILKKPKSYYEKIILQVNEHHNHETVHYFERSWPDVFSLTDKSNFLF